MTFVQRRQCILLRASTAQEMMKMNTESPQSLHYQERHKNLLLHENGPPQTESVVAIQQ